MDYNKIIGELQNRCNEKLNIAIRNKDTNNLAKYSHILQILNTPNVFDKISFEVAINILCDLGYDDSTITSIYTQLITKI